MNLSGFRSITVTLLLLAASVAILAAASAGHAQGAVNHQLVIAIVDPQKTTADRNEFRASMAERLSAVVRETCGTDYNVRPVYVGGRDARVKLDGGSYDAALVIGDDRPMALRRMAQVTLAGIMSAPRGPQPVCLILRPGNDALNAGLRAAFVRLLSGQSSPYAAVPATAQVTAIGG
jgi:hypothetical protein